MRRVVVLAALLAAFLHADAQNSTRRLAGRGDEERSDHDSERLIGACSFPTGLPS